MSSRRDAGKGMLLLEVSCDQTLIETALPSERLVEWTIKASAEGLQTQRSPLNLALVIDRSGSMAGEKLAYAKEAAAYVLDRLDERDQVALVAYDDEIQLLSGSEAVTDSLRSRLKARIRSLEPGGCTDLSGGWFTGVQQVDNHPLARAVSRVLLFTDGLANRGICDVEELVRHARELNRRGVSTSTFGVGLDYNEHLLDPMATNGGGHYYFIQHPSGIPDVFRRELGELLSTVAQDVALTIRITSGVSCSLLGDLPHEKEGTTLRIPLGAFFAAEKRTLYLKVLTPPGAEDRSLVLTAELSGKGTDDQIFSVHSEIRFTHASSARVSAQPKDPGVQERASEVELATAANQALQLERIGKRHEAATTLRARFESLRHAAPAVVQEFTELEEQLKQGLSETQRKEQHDTMYRRRASR